MAAATAGGIMARCTFTSFLILEFALLVAAFNDTTTLNVSPFAAFTAGNGLIEIAALTTLIGSQTAEYLALGDRGPIGLPWACLSAFGSFSVIRACITGACPAWLRETLGVRTTISDHSLGMSLDVVRNVRGAAQIKRKEQEAKGISVEFDPADFDDDGNKKARVPSWRDVYMFDANTEAILASTIPNGFDLQPRIVTYDYNYYKPWANNRTAWIALAVSLIKLVESYMVFRLGGLLLCGICTATWTYFFFAGLFLQFRHAWRMRASQKRAGLNTHTVDIISGELPRPMRVGSGSKKIFLGAERPDSSSLSWRIIWFFGVIITTTSLIASYIYLGLSHNKMVYTWTGFQIFWLLSRMAFHHYADALYAPGQSMLTETEFTDLTPSMKHRVLELALALGKYQSYIHPRGYYCYLEDIIFSHDIRTHFRSVSHTLTPALVLPPNLPRPGSDNEVDVYVRGVIGDSVLASALWLIQGSRLSGTDLFDTCIVFLSFSSNTSEVYAVPASRILAPGPSRLHTITPSTIGRADAENPNPAPALVPKGTPNVGWGIRYWYWIPLAGHAVAGVPVGVNRWLEICTEEPLKIRGKRRGKIMKDDELSARMGRGDVKISMSSAAEVRGTVEYSIQGWEALNACLQ